MLAIRPLSRLTIRACLLVALSLCYHRGVFAGCPLLGPGLVLFSSIPLHLLPDQSNTCTEYATCAIPSRTSLFIVLILSQAKPVGWRNGLKTEVEVVLTVISHVAEAFDW